MRTFGTFLAVGILALAVGCGGSSDSATTTNTVTTTNTTTNPTTNTVTNTVTNTATNTATNTVTASKTSTSTSTGTCNSPSCLANLAATCEPAGTCVEQTDATTGTTAACYSNGVKEIQTVNLTSRAAVVTYKQGSTTCYSVEVGADSTGAIILTFKNASGATIATGTETQDSAGSGVTTITCTGGLPVTLNSACNDTSASSTSCTQGVCSADGSTSTATPTSTKTTTTTSTSTGGGCAAATACCTSLTSSASAAEAQQCQSSLSGQTDATCDQILAVWKTYGVCQ